MISVIFYDILASSCIINAICSFKNCDCNFCNFPLSIALHGGHYWHNYPGTHSSLLGHCNFFEDRAPVNDQRASDRQMSRSDLTIRESIWIIVPLLPIRVICTIVTIPWWNPVSVWLHSAELPTHCDGLCTLPGTGHRVALALTSGTEIQQEQCYMLKYSRLLRSVCSSNAGECPHPLKMRYQALENKTNSPLKDWSESMMVFVFTLVVVFALVDKIPTENLWLTHTRTHRWTHTQTDAGKDNTQSPNWPRVKMKWLNTNYSQLIWLKKNALIWKNNNLTFEQLNNSNLTGKHLQTPRVSEVIMLTSCYQQQQYWRHNRKSDRDGST